MRLVVFDLDGTLINSEALIIETVRESFASVGQAIPTDDQIRSISGITARDAMGILAPGVDSDRIDVILNAYRAAYLQKAGLAREPMFEGALDALDRLQADPETILAVATGKGHAGAITLLERHQIIGRFNSIQTPAHNRGKPDPQMIETAMHKAGIGREATVMIGDTSHDMKMARNAGVKALGVSWGYHAVAELEAAGAHLVIHRMDELVDAVDKLLEA
ncbi:HAD family hydrolase [Devosia sp. A16]|uniref:HAD family hydrolase n=1 Tax=Devosia sp. A16 TaxID=1736675 RepID=UPI0006D7EF71|nr:HAD-IA family hydrolase [Devosia sp. A16]